MLLLEGMARETAKIVTEQVSIPVISCGAGPDCDGQILIIADILGLHSGPKPKFSKSYADLAAAVNQAVSLYAEQVIQGEYPDDQHSYHMKEGQLQVLKKILDSRKY